MRDYIGWDEEMNAETPRRRDAEGEEKRRGWRIEDGELRGRRRSILHPPSSILIFSLRVSASRRSFPFWKRRPLPQPVQRRLVLRDRRPLQQGVVLRRREPDEALVARVGVGHFRLVR